MQFSDAQFAAAWTVLEDRFHRKHNAQTVKIYRDILAAELTAEQFAEACRAAFRFGKYMPSPQELIDYGLGAGDFQARALGVWDGLVERVGRGEQATTEPGPVRSLLNSVCNGQALGMVDMKHFPFLKKEFVERYAQQLLTEARTNTPMLTAPMSEVARVLQ
ncbi:hypothetical protein [Deinococcus sp. QL22]|uniref:hypothetical protein n=1 Tax=Deinococcus sp. QL22 TaxID=2939437 RepID=UPI002017F42A|nr:hypothetical protein [Deinococcus sp. QL22]UQN06792.1 hypothetical protein M1R55_02390 [Deinococcus sp. QL22]